MVLRWNYLCGTDGPRKSGGKDGFWLFIFADAHHPPSHQSDGIRSFTGLAVTTQVAQNSLGPLNGFSTICHTGTLPYRPRPAEFVDNSSESSVRTRCRLFSCQLTIMTRRRKDRRRLQSSSRTWESCCHSALALKTLSSLDDLIKGMHWQIMAI